MKRMRGGSSDPPTGIRNVETVPQRGSAHGDLPILVGGVQIIADAYYSSARIDAVLDEVVLKTGIAVNAGEVFGDHQIDRATGNECLRFSDRRSIGQHTAGLLAK